MKNLNEIPNASVQWRTQCLNPKSVFSVMNGNILLVFFFLQFFVRSPLNSSIQVIRATHIKMWMNEFQFLCELLNSTHTQSDMTKVQTLHHHRTRCSALKSVQAGIKTTTTTRPIMPNSATKPHQMATEMKFYSHKIMCTAYMYPVSVYVCVLLMPRAYFVVV